MWTLNMLSKANWSRIKRKGKVKVHQTSHYTNGFLKAYQKDEVKETEFLRVEVGRREVNI